MFLTAQKKYITKLSEHENGTRAPIVEINVDPNLFYDIALLDSSDTFVLWYVQDIHGYELTKGYDTYVSYSGRTLYPLHVPFVESTGTLLLLSNTSIRPCVRRYDALDINDILSRHSIVYSTDETSEMFSPIWYAHFSSLARSSDNV